VAFKNLKNGGKAMNKNFKKKVWFIFVGFILFTGMQVQSPKVRIHDNNLPIYNEGKLDKLTVYIENLAATNEEMIYYSAQCINDTSQNILRDGVLNTKNVEIKEIKIEFMKEKNRIIWAMLIFKLEER
jgi:hypothetical protein